MIVSEKRDDERIRSMIPTKTSLAIRSPMFSRNMTAAPLSGINPSSENGVCKYALGLASRISAYPSHAAATPIAGPFHAMTRILERSSMMRWSSRTSPSFTACAMWSATLLPCNSGKATPEFAFTSAPELKNRPSPVKSTKIAELSCEAERNAMASSL